MKKTAIISKDGLYRYRLTRVRNPLLPRLGYIMLNPSTADAVIDDNTIKKCMHFAWAEGFGTISVVNLYAYRATNPSDLPKAENGVGPFNDHYIHKCLSGVERVVLAWGASKHADPSRVAHVIEIARQYHPVLFCFGVTKKGHPKHPCYLPHTTRMKEFNNGR